MTTEQKNLHKHILDFRNRFGKMELEFIHLLQEVERTRLHHAFGCPSVFKYAVDVVAFSESVAYTYITVARKAREIPALLSSGLSVSKASRIVSVLTLKNCDELVAFALTHTTREIDAEVARRDPRGGRERVRPLADEFFELKLSGSRDFLKKLRRVESLQAQRGKPAGPGAAIEAGLDEYIRRYDPVAKAARAAKKSAKPQSESKELCLNRVSKTRAPLTAKQKHAVFSRDGGKCTHIGHDGKRCDSDRWVEVHHIRPVTLGGSNDPENLTTLCSAHHDLVHQMNLPVDGQVSWLREKQIPYAI